MAKFQKGHPKLGGRAPGTTNKRRSIEQVCEEAGVDPFKVMTEFLKGDDPNLKFQSAKELCQYLEAKKKSLDVAIDPENNAIKVIIEDYRSK